MSVVVSLGLDVSTDFYGKCVSDDEQHEKYNIFMSHKRSQRSVVRLACVTGGTENFGIHFICLSATDNSNKTSTDVGKSRTGTIHVFI